MPEKERGDGNLFVKRVWGLRRNVNQAPRGGSARESVGQGRRWEGGGGNEATQVRVPDKRKKKVKGELPQALKLLSQGMGVLV